MFGMKKEGSSHQTVQFQGALLNHVLNASRCAHNNVGTTSQGSLLGLIGAAPIHADSCKLEDIANELEVRMNLQSHQQIGKVSEL